MKRKTAINQCREVRQVISKDFINKDFTARELYTFVSKEYEITYKHITDLLRRIKSCKRVSGKDYGNLSHMMAALGCKVEVIGKRGREIVYQATRTSGNLENNSFASEPIQDHTVEEKIIQHISNKVVFAEAQRRLDASS